MRFQLRQVNENIGFHRRAAKQVIVPFSRMALVRLGHVIRRAVEASLAWILDEFAGVIEGNFRALAWIARFLLLRDHPAVHSLPFFWPEIQKRNSQPGETFAEALDHLVEPAILT